MKKPLKEPVLPVLKHVSEYGNYRETRDGYLDTVLWSQSYDANDDHFYGGESETALEEYKGKKFWDYDTRIDLEDLIKNITMTTDTDNVYLNIRRDRSCYEIEVSLIEETKMDKKALDKKKRDAEDSYRAELVNYKEDKARWEDMKTSEKIKLMEKELKKLKDSRRIY